MKYIDLIKSGKMNKSQVELLFKNLLLFNLTNSDGDYYSASDLAEDSELNTVLHDQAEAFMDEDVSDDFLLFGTWDENTLN